MAGRFTREIFNYREEIIAADLMRAQALASREVQDTLKNDGRSLDATANFATVGAPFSGANLLPTLIPSSPFNQVLIGEGQVFNYNPAVTGDDSKYQVTRWGAQSLTVGLGGANPRVDLIVATPGVLNIGAVSRNVLVDPVTRTVNPVMLSKIEEPTATLAVVAGTAAAAPQPPAVPAGAVALFEVYVPAAPLGNDSANYVLTRRLFRAAHYPMSAQHGILKGCVVKWTRADEAAASADEFLDSSTTHAAVIDGEVVSWYGDITFVDDLTAPPVAAVATADVPYYIYLVGGRNSPHVSTNGRPVLAVRSLTAPDENGRPFGAVLSTARSVALGTPIPTSACLYIGVGWICAGTTRRKSCRIVGDQIFAMNGLLTETQLLSMASTNGVVTAVAATASTPAPSTWLRGRMTAVVGGGGGSDLVTVYSGDYSALKTGTSIIAVSNFVDYADATYETSFLLGGAPFQQPLAYATASAAGTTVNLYIQAYNMNVRRLG